MLHPRVSPSSPESKRNQDICCTEMLTPRISQQAGARNKTDFTKFLDITSVDVVPDTHGESKKI